MRLPWDYGNYGLDPDRQRIVDAVRASMSIPFFFEPVQFTAPAATYEGVTYTKGSVTWVDGGLLSNFPVEVFDRSDGATAAMADDRHQTVGPRHDVPSAAQATTRSTKRSTASRRLLNNADRYYLTPDKVARTIFIDSTGITATDFDITPEQRETLFANGQQSASQWLDEAHVPQRCRLRCRSGEWGGGGERGAAQLISVTSFEHDFGQVGVPARGVADAQRALWPTHGILLRRYGLVG